MKTPSVPKADSPATGRASLHISAKLITFVVRSGRKRNSLASSSILIPGVAQIHVFNRLIIDRPSPPQGYGLIKRDIN